MEVLSEVNQPVIHNLIILSQEQKAKILGLINSNPTKPPSLRDLLINIFPDKRVDGRSFEGKAIKEYLSTLNIKAQVTYDMKYDKEFDLTDSQKLYIRNNANTMTIIEMARILFNNEKICKINLEYKAIRVFLDINNIKPFNPDELPIKEAVKFIPKTLTQAAIRVNKYVLDGIDTKTLKKDTRLQNCLQVLIKYYHTPRYSLLLNTLADGIDLELFESSFTRYVWDKPDLTEEEVDTYINLCCDIVNYTKMQREVERMSETRDKCLDDSEGMRLSMALVTQIKELYTEMDNNHKRQNAALKNLIGTRNDRMEGLRKNAVSVSQLVEAWRDKQKRDRQIALAERRKEMARNEIQHLDTMDAFKAEIFGLNREAFE